jgi:hypothetical protein
MMMMRRTGVPLLHLLGLVILLTGADAWSSTCSTSTKFRAYLPIHSNFRSQLIQDLSETPDSWIESRRRQVNTCSSFVESSVHNHSNRTGDHDYDYDYDCSFHQLPANKICIVVQLQERVAEEEQHQTSLSFDTTRLESAIQVWKCLGNQLPQSTFSHDTSFKLTLTRPTTTTSTSTSKRRGRTKGRPAASSKKSKQHVQTLTRQLSEDLVHRFGWSVCQDNQEPTLAFQLVVADLAQDSQTNQDEEVTPCCHYSYVWNWQRWCAFIPCEKRRPQDAPNAWNPSPWPSRPKYNPKMSYGIPPVNERPF